MAPGFLQKIGKALRGRTDAGSPVTTPDERIQPDTPAVTEIIGGLRELVVQHGDGAVLSENVGAGDPLFDRGHIDSMSGISLLTYIEDHYGVLIEDFELVETLTSLRALAQRIAERQSTAGST